MVQCLEHDTLLAKNMLLYDEMPGFLAHVEVPDRNVSAPLVSLVQHVMVRTSDSPEVIHVVYFQSINGKESGD